MPASVPPASTATASPCRIQLAAWPIASAPEAHALTTAMFGPRAPRSIETIPGAMSTSAIAAANGDTRRAPSASSTRVVFSITSSPPMPDAIRTPMSGDSAAMSRPESSAASRAAAMANCTCGVPRRASLEPKMAAASNPLTSPAMRTGRREASKCEIAAMPLRPARSASQLSDALLPTGETLPIPVTTTRRGPGSAMAARMGVRR